MGRIFARFLSRSATKSALKDSIECLELGWKGVGFGIWDWNILTNEMTFSDRFKTLLGYAPGELPQHYEQWVKRLHPDDKQQTLSALQTHLKHRKQYNIEYRMLTKSGQWRWFHTTGQAAWDKKGNATRMVGSLADITERKHNERERELIMEKLLESNTELERFAYVASHDMQEPIRMVTNFSEIICKDYNSLLDEEGKECLRLIADSGKRMHSIIDDLLDYSRIGNEDNHMISCDGENVLEGALENLCGLITSHNAQISYDPFPPIYGNPVQIMRLIQNLVANGIKYQPSGNRPHIHIGFMNQPEQWCISIRDNGIGINEKFIEQIFQPFRRLHAWEQYEGTGLGLSICKKIVENHGGRIWATSAPGEGSLFYFTLCKPQPKQLEAA